MADTKDEGENTETKTAYCSASAARGNRNKFVPVRLADGADSTRRHSRRRGFVLQTP